MSLIKIVTISITLSAFCFFSSCDPQGTAQQKNEVSSNDDITVVTYDANATDAQTIQAKPNSSIDSAAVTIQPGSLTIGTELSIEEGGSIATDDLSETLGLEDTEVEAGGPAVAILSSSILDATVPFTLALPIAEGTNLTQANKDNIIIIYKVTKEADNGALTLGVFPSSAITIEGNLAKIDTKWFGVYQVAFASKAIAVAKEILTANPLVLKRKINDVTGRWVSDCKLDSDGESETDGDTKNPQWARDSMGFSHDKITYQSVLFQDENCKKSFLRFEFAGDYNIPRTDSSQDVKPIDVTLKVAFVTVTNIIALKFANKPNGGLCGQTDWILNVPKRITDFSLCESNKSPESSGSESNLSGECVDSGPQLGKTIYSIFSVANNELKTGKDLAPNCGNSPETRNVVLDDEVLKKI